MVGVKSWIWTSTQISVRLTISVLAHHQCLGLLFRVLEHLGGPLFTVVPFFFHTFFLIFWKDQSKDGSRQIMDK